MPTAPLPCILLAFFLFSCGNASTDEAVNANVHQEDSCEWCGTKEAPANISWRTTIPPAQEQGEKMIISGTVFQEDGKTPASDVLVYVYHTNKDGVYPMRGNEKGNAKRHGYLRGWMKTNVEGKYKYETIKPGPYPTHEGEPAHVHYVIEAPGYPEYWLTGLWFEDDPRLTAELLEKVPKDGGISNLTALVKDDNGMLHGKRDLILQRFED